jgi:hypothetical protein
MLRVALYSLIRARGKLHSSQDKVKAKNGLWSGQFRNLLHTKRIQELTVSDFLSSCVLISDADITGQMPDVANEINCLVPSSVRSRASN